MNEQNNPGMRNWFITILLVILSYMWFSPTPGSPCMYNEVFNHLNTCMILLCVIE